MGGGENNNNFIMTQNGHEILDHFRPEERGECKKCQTDEKLSAHGLRPFISF